MSKPSVSMIARETSYSARNYIENLLVEGDMSIEKYEILADIINMMDSDNCIILGDGLKFKLLDDSK
jgi:hypothetical protein